MYSIRYDTCKTSSIINHHDDVVTVIRDVHLCASLPFAHQSGRCLLVAKFRQIQLPDGPCAGTSIIAIFRQIQLLPQTNHGHQVLCIMMSSFKKSFLMLLHIYTRYVGMALQGVSVELIWVVPRAKRLLLVTRVDDICALSIYYMLVRTKKCIIIVVRKSNVLYVIYFVHAYS